MSEDFDTNKIVAEFLNENLERFYNTGRGILKGAAEKIQLHLSKSYKDYLSCITQRYSKTKSFFIRDAPSHLYNFYVPLTVSNGKTKIKEASIGKLSSVNPFVVITAQAGSGKSILMRHLLLDAVIKKEKVPIFLDLRDFNHTQRSLIEFIQNTLHQNQFELDNSYIEKAMKAGHFLFLFDGFDEIVHALRKDVTQQIHELVKLYDKNIAIVSSRPDDEFSGWPSFSVFRIDPLSLEQASKLIERLPYDPDIKAKFIKDLRKNLFEKHTSFLSNPLLLSIMLLTYGQNADIPNKLSLFYSQAYEALFQRHDALKVTFQRDRLCKLDIQEFERVFSAFSIQTYDKSIFQFTRSEALQYVEKCKKIVNLEFNTNDFLTDALQAVSLLLEDGLLIVFAHRSFQEYFVARFISDTKPEVQEKLIDKYSKNTRTDNVLSLLYEIKPELVERVYIIPGIERLESFIKLKKSLSLTHYTKYLKAAYSSFDIYQNELSAYSGSDKHGFSDLVSFTLWKCGHEIGWTNFPVNDDVYFLAEKYEALENPVSIETSDLTATDEFTRDLSSNGQFFSIKTLQLVIRIKKALIQKHKSADVTLEEILDS
jgi:hypothetical protein